MGHDVCEAEVTGDQRINKQPGRNCQEHPNAVDSALRTNDQVRPSSVFSGKRGNYREHRQTEGEQN
jgi:hypothetical protein